MWIPSAEPPEWRGQWRKLSDPGIKGPNGRKEKNIHSAVFGWGGMRTHDFPRYWGRNKGASNEIEAHRGVGAPKSAGDTY